MDTRNFIFALVLSVAVLVIWQMIFPPARPGAPLEPGPEVADRSVPALPVAPLPGVDEAVQRAPGAEPAPTEPAAEPAVAASAEVMTTVETAAYLAKLSNRGGQLISFHLKEHDDAQGQQVDLVRRRAGGPYPFGLTDLRGEALSLNEELFLTQRATQADGREAVEFRFRGASGAAVKRFVFGDRLLEIDFEVSGVDSWAVLLGPGIRNPDDKELENRFARRAGVYLSAGDVERVDPQRTDEPGLVGPAALGWAGLEDTYFLTALVPAAGVGQVVLQPVLVHPDAAGARFEAFPASGELSEAQDELPRELALLAVAEGSRITGDAYLGAKRFDLLSKLPHGLQRSVNLGFFEILARPLLAGLRWIYERVVANYGWAIVLMTVLIRILLFPLTHKSVSSMQKMQELNPKMQSIRTRYRPKLKDKQGRPNAEMQRKMNEEIMALYKSEGVNPAGGCLPMLLQIPVLFAFYNLLSTAIELRHAPWLLWVQDLSAPDPLRVLPIVMGVSQFVQQKVTPSGGDPMQRRMFMLMPVFFTFLFMGFPSGLVLYWLTNNLLGIVQQLAYARWRAGKEEANAGG